MREIKFRAWDKERNKFITDNDVPYSNCAINLITLTWWEDSKEFELRKWDNLVYQQYTGLKDKNGKEIYEGDVVKNIYDDDIKCILEVRFGRYGTGFDSDCAIGAIGQGFYFKWLKGGRDFLGTPYMEHIGKEWCENYLGEHIDWESEFEVIGNIYENPELIRGGNNAH